MREWLLIVALLVASTGSAGCIFGCGRYVDKEWVQAGVFEGFPPEGPRGEYSISWRDPPEYTRSARTASGPLDEHRVSVSVYDDDSVRWNASGSTDENDSETADLLRKTFSDLGLPAPTPPDWDFSWGQAC